MLEEGKSVLPFSSTVGWGKVKGWRLLGELAEDFVSRFVSPGIAKKYDLSLPAYEGIDQVVEVGVNGERL